MMRTAAEHDLLVLELGSKLLPILSEHETGVGLATLLTIVGTLLVKHCQSSTDDSAPDWVGLLLPMISVALDDIAHAFESPTMRES